MYLLSWATWGLRDEKGDEVTGVCMCNERVCVCVCARYCCLLQWYLMCTYDYEPQARFPFENVVRTITDCDFEKLDKLHKWAVFKHCCHHRLLLDFCCCSCFLFPN